MIGNLPFNVASAILRKLCAWRSRIARMVLMFQREVAERIRAGRASRAMAMLSVISALYWEIESHFSVAAGSFHPRPKVDAEVLVMRPRAASPFAADEEQALLDTVRASFSAAARCSATRSQAGSKSLRRAPKPACARRDLSRARAETLAVADFVRLARALRSPRCLSCPKSNRSGGFSRAPWSSRTIVCGPRRRAAAAAQGRA